MKIGDRVLVHGEVDEIRGETVIIHFINSKGYFVTSINENVNYSDYEVSREKAHKEGYEAGLNDAWEFTRKIARMDSAQRFDCFGGQDTGNIVLYVSYDNALQVYRKWEKSHD